MSTAYSSAKQKYIGNGVTTEWGFDFPIQKHSELKVYLKRSSLPQVLLEEGVDYSFVTENTITFPIKTGESKLQATDVLALQRESVFESEYNFSNQQRLEPEEVMHADDNLERQIQELKRDSEYAIKVQPTSNINTDEYFIAVESIYENLDNITNVSVISAEIVNCSNNIEAIQDAPNQANAASQSASNAAQSATNASQSASDAAQSATNAANSATDSANSATASANSAQAAQNALNDVQGLIATPIGTIFQSIYVDESLDIARKLNGQLISSTKFTGLRQWLNTVQTASPNLFTTETNWQAEKTNSKLGQCGKFVVDDTAGTIRLPCVVNAQGLTDLALIGGIKSESLPNFQANLGDVFPYTETSGAVTSTKKTVGWTIVGGSNYVNGDTTVNPSVTSSTYQDNAPVQQEAVQYPYYIQVATGVEETLPAIREYNINTPFFFGQSMYSDIAPDNASWLASNGQYNAKTVYPDYYNWILENINKGVKGFWGQTAYAYGDANGVTYLTTSTPQVGSVCYNMSYQRSGYIEAVYSDGSVKIRDDIGNASYDNIHYYPTGNISSTSLITDYDFVINTTDQTFRLPLKNGQEGIFADGVKGNGISIGLSCKDGTNLALGGQSVATDNGYSYYLATQLAKYGSPVGTAMGGFSTPAANTTFGLTTDPSKSGMVVDKTVPSGWNLYYYVGDTVQDASLINAGAVLGQLSDKISRTAASDKEMVVGWGMPDYTAGISITSYNSANNKFTAPCDGIIMVAYLSTNTSANLPYINDSQFGSYNQGAVINHITQPVNKGDTFFCTGIHNQAGSGCNKFYPLKGVN